MKSEPAAPLRLMLVCGEPSGDQLGAQLIAALKAISSEPIEFMGVGGPAMAAEGLSSIFPIDVTSVMGLREIVPRLPEILRRIRAATDFALAARPDALVCIDSPEFTHRVAKRLRRSGSKTVIVNYVAPQVWASRPYRAKTMVSYFNLVLALLPFEVSFFEKHGLPARFVGHPAVERKARVQGGEALRARLRIGQRQPLLLILPGSRVSEVRPLLPVFRKTVEMVCEAVPGLTCVLPVVSHVAHVVRDLAIDWPVPLHIVEREADKFAAFDAADAALAASGTVTTELALAEVPMAVAYKLGWITSLAARALIRIPYVSLVNLVLQRQAVPEFLQRRCRAELIAPCIIRLLHDPDFRSRQQQDLRQAVHMLGVDEEPPSRRAAKALLDFLRERRLTA
jgi:lipid-A-disaccharide synthase